jgi:hypothetical protein
MRHARNRIIQTVRDLKIEYNELNNLYYRKFTYNLEILELSNFCWQEFKVIVTKVQGSQSF